MVIDDNVDGAQALCAVLEAMGCATALAFNGAQGLSMATGFDPHLALIDLEMPGMGGCEVARLLRADPARGMVRLVCLTGRAEPEVRRLCRAAGFDEFFTKPIPPESLMELLAGSNESLLRGLDSLGSRWNTPSQLTAW